MRIISGKARGTKLYSLEGQTTRPTLDRVKESLFNIIQNDIQDCVFLDLFAGSGAIGLEASSRGAKEVILCEKNRNAIEIIKKNIQKTHLEDKTKLYEMSFENLLKKLNKKVDIIYIDPPYKTDFVYESIKIINEKKLLNDEGTIIIETDEEDRIKKQLENLDIEIESQRKYGRVNLIFVKTKRDS